MNRDLLIVSLSLVWALTSAGWARAQSDDVRELREQVRALLDTSEGTGLYKPRGREMRDRVQALLDKLNALDPHESSSITRQRTTELSSPPVQAVEQPVVSSPPGQEAEEPQVVVQIYDLSDLLAFVVPYPAMVSGDLGPFDQPVFPGLSANASGTGGMSGMNGMGGMGMGGMGGGMGGMGMGGQFSVPALTMPLRQQPATPTPPVVQPPNMGARGGMGAAQPRPAPADFSGVRISLDTLIDAITQTIDPKSWDQNGGQGTIAALGNNLLISATPQTHEKITKLFDVFRKRWGTLRTVSVQAHWLWLSDVQLAALLAEGQAKGDPRPAGGYPAFGLVNDAAWESLLKELRQADKHPAGYQAVLTCYNGQTVHAVSGSQRRVIGGMIPVVGGEAQPAYMPVVATLQEGAALQVTPMVTSAGKLVVLDLHSRVVLLRGGPDRGALALEAAAAGKSAARDVAAVVDRPSIANQHLETTLRVPVDRRMLVGGMTFEAQPKPGDPSLYLFVKPMVQELRDDQPAAKAAAKPVEPAKPAAAPNPPAAQPTAPAKAK
ncbi:MAG: hypothetical protein ABSG86_27705 [Thermoguttaceae bacterium]|jgi:hypothetical protein